MRSSLCLLFIAGVLSAGAATAAPAPPAKASGAPAQVELPVPPEQVVNHVSRTIAWYRRMLALQQIPADSDDIVPRDRLSQTALTSLQLSFDFGRAAGAMASAAQEAPDASDQDSEIDRAAARMADRITNLQSQLATANDEAKRAEISAALDLAREIQSTVGQIQKFEETTDAHAGGASGGLAAQISDLRKSVPELHGAAAPTPAADKKPASASNTAETFRPESAGVIALIGKWFSLESARRELADATKQTDGMTKDLGKMRDAVVQQIRTLSNQNLQATSNDPAALAQSKLKFQQAAVRFKQLATLIVPLGEQGVTLETAHNLLEEWRDSLAARTGTVARYLLLRLGFLLGSVAAEIGRAHV